MSDERELKFQEAVGKIDAFIARHDEYTREGVEQPRQGNTNYVVFARRRDEQVVFKEFCTTERKARECFAMRHYQSTGLVPDILWDDDPTLMIMSYIPGAFLGRGNVSRDEILSGCLEAGKAFGILSQMPWTEEDQAFLDSPLCGGWPQFDEEFDDVMKLSRDIKANHSGLEGDFWQESLAFIDSQRDTILSQPRFLCHQDAVHFHLLQGRFMQFFDLEMCFVGGEAAQLGFVLDTLVNVWRDHPDRWRLFREGWEGARHKKMSGEDLQSAVAMQQWRSWDQLVNNPTDSNRVKYRNQMTWIQAMILG